MSASYQAVYDAVNLNFSGASYLWQHLQQEIYAVSHEMQRPSVLYRPRLREEGEQWIASYHEVVGYGETPAKAMADFDAAWTRGITSAAAEAVGS